MKYSRQEVLQYLEEEDVKFIRLAFCDVFGRQKNISIMPQELPRAFSSGIAIDASAIAGFGDETHSDLLLYPDTNTLMPLPWRPEHGRVVRMFCNIFYPDGRRFACDSRAILARAVETAQEAGYQFFFGAEQEFYLFKLDEMGEPTKIPYDHAGYMDIAPEDRGENIRREICLTLEQMGILPESSHHEEGPGQNEIDFRYSDPLAAADNAMTFQTVVKAVALRNGLAADFGPKPLKEQPGNGFHINLSVKSLRKEPGVLPGSLQSDETLLPPMVAGILEKVREMTLFFNPSQSSYLRFGQNKAPAYVSWSHENRSQLIRIPAAAGEYRRAELRSPDPSANPYLSFALMIYAGLYGIQKQLKPPAPADFNLFQADERILAPFQKLPANLTAARKLAANSSFIRSCLPEAILKLYTTEEPAGTDPCVSDSSIPY